VRAKEEGVDKRYEGQNRGNRVQSQENSKSVDKNSNERWGETDQRGIVYDILG
jgi:hypothetical protein